MTNLALLCLFCLLTAASVSAGSVSVKNEAGYVASIEGYYVDPTTKVAKYLDPEKFTLGQTKKFEIPEGANSVELTIKYYKFIGVSDVLFNKSFTRFEGGINECYKIYGTIWSPQYDKISC